MRCGSRHGQGRVDRYCPLQDIPSLDLIGRNLPPAVFENADGDPSFFFFNVEHVAHIAASSFECPQSTRLDFCSVRGIWSAPHRVAMASRRWRSWRRGSRARRLRSRESGQARSSEGRMLAAAGENNSPASQGPFSGKQSVSLFWISC